MFETLFTYRGVQRRHQQGRAADARERFLSHCADQGMARTTLRRIARELLVIADRIEVTAGQTIALPDIEAFAARWAREQQRRHRARQSRWSRELFVQTATSWFRFLGYLDQPALKPTPFADSLRDFAAQASSERGLSPVTVRNRCWHVQKFVDWLNGQRGPIPRQTPRAGPYRGSAAKRSEGRFAKHRSPRASIRPLGATAIGE